MLDPALADWLREVGQGNLSRGITLVALTQRTVAREI